MDVKFAKKQAIKAAELTEKMGCLSDLQSQIKNGKRIQIWFLGAGLRFGVDENEYSTRTVDFEEVRSVLEEYFKNKFFEISNELKNLSFEEPVVALEHTN